MSSRQLRKLQQQRELERSKLQKTHETEETASEGGDEGDNETPPVSKPSLFANFAALQADDNQDEDSDAGEHIVGNHGENPPVDEQFISPSSGKKHKKAKKKKNKMSGSAKQVEGNKLKSALRETPADGRRDEIDAALQELSLKRETGYMKTTAPAAHPEYERICALLGINTQHLKVGNEMRNLFGRTAVENHDDAGGAVPRGARRRQRGAQRQVDLETALKGHHVPGKGLPELTLRRNVFIQGKDDWPRAPTGGLTMNITDDEMLRNGVIVFRFVHDQAYDLVQQQFQVLVEMGDPQNLIGLLQRNPYNISLLLQVSKIAKDQTDHALSSDLVERALFTFGRAAQSLFSTKLSQGKARLEFERPENREFWLAGYQYIRSLMMKGTYRTALEWAKVLFALEPGNDPYCMLLMIHHLALRSFESQYVLDVYENRMLGDWSMYVPCMSPSLALAAMQLKEPVRARSLLRQSIQRLPWLFCRLFQELNLENPPPSIWGAEPRTDAENLFSEIYVRQTKDLWNTPEAISLLMEVTHATDKLNYRDLPILDNTKITLNVARFVYLDNTPALMALVPSQLLHRNTNSDSDPLPPDQNIFSWPSQRTNFSREDNSRGMDRAFGDHFDPIAALRALVPGLGNVPAVDGAQPFTDNELREFLDTEVNRQGATAAAIDSGDEIDEVEDGDQEREVVGYPGASGARRLYEFFFGSRSQEQAEEAHDEAEPELEPHGHQLEQEQEDH